jgi:hypothetical protein
MDKLYVLVFLDTLEAHLPVDLNVLPMPIVLKMRPVIIKNAKILVWELVE